MKISIKSNPYRLIVIVFIILITLAWGFTNPSTVKARNDNKVLVDASSNNFPPVNFLNEEGNLTGFGLELADAVAREAGIEITHIHSNRWVDVLRWLESGKADFIHDTGYTKDRDRFLDYSNPIIEMPEVIFVRQNRWDINELDSLKGMKVACVRKHITHLYLQNFPKIECQLVETPIQGIYELAAGKVDAFIYPKQIAMYMIQNLRLSDKIKIVGSPLRTLKWSMVVKEGNKEVLSLLNEGLQKVRASGEYDRIYNKWWGKKLFAGYTKGELQTISGLAAVLSAIFVLSLTLLYFNFKLRKDKTHLKNTVSELFLKDEALKESEEKYRQLFQMESDAIFIIENATGFILEVNTAASVIYGYTREEFLERKNIDISAEPDKTRKSAESGEEVIPVRYHRKKDGTVFPVEITATHMTWQGREVHIAAVRDITFRIKAEEEKAKIEEQYQQAQKMEAVGTLAGGVAHDFNNLLQAINGYSEILLLEKTESDPEYETVLNIRKAGARAAQLVKQLLLFSRKMEIERRPVNLNLEVENARKLLERTIPKMVDIKVRSGNGLWVVKADPVQMEQILLNLGINASDAMPDGGELVIETENVVLDESNAKNHIGAEPGRYVLLTVSDTGHGMDKHMVEHIFEPFYTTKEIGKGTGLGLASTYGIVRSHGGCITCYSEIGQGTVFRVYLPAIIQADADEREVIQAAQPKGGDETILVVDDEKPIRDFASQALKKFGYTVATASSGEEAIEIYTDHSREIELIIMDIGMPGIGGYKCLKEILKIDSEAKIIIASGYSVNGQVGKSLEAGAAGYVGKPYQLKDLLEKVRSVLDAHI